MERVRLRRQFLCATAAPPPAPSGSPLPSHPAPTERTLLFSQLTAGAIAGLANVVLLSPLEVVKVRLQAQARASSSAAAALPYRYHGLAHALRVMWRQEGWRSYYRGINASLWAFVPNWAVYWVSYEALKRRMTPANTQTPPPVHVLSAIGAGAGTAVATAPLWTLKSRLQTEIAVGAKRRRYKSVWSGLRRIVADEGFPALYKGLSPTLLGLGHVAIQFPCYEHLKRRLSNNREEDLRPVHILVASSVSKIVASAAFYHHEVVRVRMQVDIRVYAGRSEPVRMAKLYSDILRTEGVRGLYRGFGTNLIRTYVFPAVFVLVCETLFLALGVSS